MFKRLAAILLLPLLLLTSCTNQDAIKVGSKNFGESNVLAQMFVILLRENGVPVAGPVEYPSTQSALEALKRGDVDIYPDYNGTGLLMIGQNPIADGDAATKLVEELYQPLGLTWLPRLGFANNYGLVMRADRAKELGITTISDLVAKASGLKLGLEADFQLRPLDGLQPLTARYGMQFGSLDVVPLDERAKVYDKLLDGAVDVGEVYTTDGQIADYDMVILQDDLSFFPVYEAAPLARADALARQPAARAAIEKLAGKLDAATMRQLNSRVDIDGRSPETVARAALAEMGLAKPGVASEEAPVVVSATPLLADSSFANAALRAARKAFDGREVTIAPSANPLAPVGAGEARLALVAADAFFDLSGPTPVRNEGYEAVGSVGQTVVHLMSRTPIADIKTLVTGPAGSAGNRLGATLAAGLGLTAQVVAAEAETSEALGAAMQANNAEAVLVVAPLGNDIITRLEEGTGLSLQGLQRWKDKANLIRYPFLREVRVPADTYPGQTAVIDTLGEQVVLAGPAPSTDLVGEQGPGAVATALQAIPESAVTVLAKAVPGAPLIDPTLRQAAALAPPMPKLPASISPSPAASVLNLAIIFLMLWLGWLYIRPERT